MRVAAMLLAVVLVPACSHDSPTAPTPAFGSHTGTWAGAVSDPINGSGTMRVELTELSIDPSRSLIGGAWTTTFADPSKNAAGSIGGILSAGQLSITASPTPTGACTPVPLVAPGTFSIAATVAGNEITGTYVFSTCSGSAPGTHRVASPVTSGSASPRSPRRPAAAPRDL